MTTGNEMLHKHGETIREYCEHLIDRHFPWPAGQVYKLAPDLIDLAKFIVDHPNAGRGLGDVPHGQWMEMQSKAQQLLAKAQQSFAAKDSQ